MTQIREEFEFEVDVPPAVLMEILRDVEGMPEWSKPYLPSWPKMRVSATIVEQHADGTPRLVRGSTSTLGITDSSLTEYLWAESSCSWTVLESKVMKAQRGRYDVVAQGRGSRLVASIEGELKVALPALFAKQLTKFQKQFVGTAQKALVAEAARRTRGRSLS